MSKLCSSISVTSLFAKKCKGKRQILSLHCGELLLVNTMAVSCTVLLIILIFIGIEPAATLEVRTIIYSSTSIQVVIVVKRMQAVRLQSSLNMNNDIWIQLFDLSYHTVTSKFTFKTNLRHYLNLIQPIVVGTTCACMVLVHVFGVGIYFMIQ